jgi:ankyrin repeat protein
LKNINRATRAYAHRLLQCLTVAVRPLHLEELAEVLAFDFDEASGGVPKLNADWRREDQEQAVLSTCSSLITVVHDGDSRVVQFSHFSVKEFLTSDRLAAAVGDISFHHIDLEPAHAILAQACLGVVLRLDDSTRETSVERFPLAEYAAEHWVKHALFEGVSFYIKDGMANLFDSDKPHFSRWIRIHDMDDSPANAPVCADAAPVYYAALCGFRDMVEKLISEHPEHVSASGGRGGTALHAASNWNHLEIVQSLLKHGADVNALGLWERTPLHFASLFGHLEIGRWLLEHGADVNAKQGSHGTPLHLATFGGHFELVRALLGHHAGIDAQNDEGNTPLHVASESGYVNIARFLLDNGADPNAREHDQQTPLHLASTWEMGHLLLEYGVDVDAVNDFGKTAYELALHHGQIEIARLLSGRSVENKA